MIVALRAPSLAKFGEVDTVPVSEKCDNPRMTESWLDIDSYYIYGDTQNIGAHSTWTTKFRDIPRNSVIFREIPWYSAKFRDIPRSGFSQRPEESWWFNNINTKDI